jgi:hypothetical protein
MSRQCRNCIYWGHVYTHENDCRRFPPAVVRHDSSNETLTRFPKTRLDCVCGEHSSVETDPEIERRAE